MPEQDDGMSWFDKVKFFISMWIVVFVVFSVWGLFARHHARNPFSVGNAAITGVVALVVTIFIMVTKIPE